MESAGQMEKIKGRHDMLRGARHADDDTPVVVHLSVTERLKRKVKVGRVWDPPAGHYEISISFV